MSMFARNSEYPLRLVQISGLLILLLIPSSCKDNTTQPIVERTDDDIVREIVFRDMFQRRDWGAGLPYYYFFLAYVVTDTAGFFDHHIDPPQSLMVLFQDSPTPVRTFSQMTTTDSGYYDTQTNMRGVAFDTWPLKWSSSVFATMESSYFYGPRNAQGYRYYLQKQTTGWVIDSLRFTWAARVSP
jgi:hypothetical protein